MLRKNIKHTIKMHKDKIILPKVTVTFSKLRKSHQNMHKIQFQCYRVKFNKNFFIKKLS